MKKTIAAVLAIIFALGMVGCAADGSGQGTAEAAGNPLDVLNKVWDSYTDDEKFPAAGGDMSEANMKDDAPGNVALDDADTVAYLTSFPADMVDKLDAAASLMHMMNANTFTCGALRVKNGDDAAKLAEDLRDAIQNKQWMCGFPDKLVIATLGNYVVSVYGDEELVNTFRDKLQAAYSDAAIAYDEMIGEGEFSDGEDTALEAPVA